MSKVMVVSPEDYTWSSYHANGLGMAVKLWTPHRIYRELGPTVAERSSAYRELFLGQLGAPLLNQIRQASNQGMALGSDRFKAEVERLTGRRVNTLKRGPKAKRKGGELLL